jgi:integrase/recombinase XerC
MPPPSPPRREVTAAPADLPAEPALPDALVGVLESFLRHLAVEKRLSAHTLTAYRHDLYRFHRLLSPGQSRFTPAEVRAIAARLSRQGLHARSIRRFLSAVRSYGTWMVREGHWESNPAALVRGPKCGRPLPRVLDADQAARAMQGPAEDRLVGVRDRAILELLYSSGLRLAELTGLNLGSLDLQAGWVRVLGKGQRERVVPVGRQARQALQAWLTVRDQWAPSGEVALFVSCRGRRIANRTVHARIAQAGRQAGLGERLHPHRLRHAFASHVLESSGDLRAVQEMLGHASLSSTQIYTHLDFQHLAQVYDRTHPRARRSPQAPAEARTTVSADTALTEGAGAGAGRDSDSRPVCTGPAQARNTDP